MVENVGTFEAAGAAVVAAGAAGAIVGVVEIPGGLLTEKIPVLSPVSRKVVEDGPLGVSLTIAGPGGVVPMIRRGGGVRTPVEGVENVGTVPVTPLTLPIGGVGATTLVPVTPRNSAGSLRRLKVGAVPVTPLTLPIGGVGVTTLVPVTPKVAAGSRRRLKGIEYVGTELRVPDDDGA